MELQFQKKEVPWLRSVLDQVQNLEQTQELRIPEGMPGAARILGCWGQVLLRGKEWDRDEVSLSGGIQIFVLYEPEDGTQPRRLESWIPFRMDWSLPSECPEGTVRFYPLLRFAEARLVSAGKLLIRAGIGILAQCWVPEIGEVSSPGELPEDVELLRQSWPVQLPREAGEKAFEMEEMLTLPPSAPQPEELIYARMSPAVSDRKVLGNKIVFRGNGNLHVLYRCDSGQLCTWDFEVPFSQFAELEGSHSTDARADVMMALTDLETEPMEDGRIRLRAGLTGQYLVDDRELLETVEDVYSPRRELTVHRQQLQMPVLLDSRRENLYGEQTIPIQADMVADAVLLPDFPRQRREEDHVTLEQPGTVQLLYYDPQGQLQSAVQKMEGNVSFQADEQSRISAVPQTGTEPQIMTGVDNMTIRTEMPVQLLAQGGQGIPVVTGLEPGEYREPEPGRPSLILRRAGSARLWDMARAGGSTVTAIREANGLEGEPEPGRMLLIPVL